MYNFSLTKSEYIPEISSEVLLYTHTSGARLVYAKNEDKNRVVMPVFKTLPQNDKGIPHIVEHCTLCGSQKYQLKDPFNVLEKGSIYTYLNAITYEDKTVYPVASTDEDELKKMAAVYADALFSPLMTQNEGIFRQEGVYRDKNGFNGVVLNEMKGAFSSERKKLGNALCSKLYDRCSYRYYSGGIPESIKQLDYEEFKHFYRERYTGANCLVYIYGDVDIEYYMRLFDSYLKDGETAPVSYDVIYSYTGEDISVKAGSAAEGVCGVTFAMCNAESYEECIYLSVLGEALISCENSILRQRMVDSGIAVKVSGGYDDSSRATRLSIFAEGADFNRFKAELNNIFTDLVKNGVPKDKISAAVSRLKFYIKERDFGYKPEGLFFGLELMKGLLYGDSSFEPLKIETVLDGAENADYAHYIEKYLLNKGVYGYTVKGEQTEQECTMPINDEPLKKFQSQTDSAEMLATIPAKNVRDIAPEPLWFDYDFDSGCLFTEDNKSNIVYLDLVYPLAGHDISAAAFYGLTSLYMDTELMAQCEKLFGKFTAQADSFDKNGKSIPVIMLSFSFLRDNIRDCISIINRFTSTISFADKKSTACAAEQRTAFKRGMQLYGNRFAYRRALACVNKNDILKDRANGAAMYDWLCGERNFAKAAQEIADYIANTKPAAVLRGNADDRKYIAEHLSLADKLPDVSDFNAELFKGGGFYTGSDVNNTALALKLPYYKGSFALAQAMIESGYIWDKIRLEGGAYGGGCAFLRNGTMYMYSYRDPQLEKTKQVFKNVGRYLSTLDISDSEFNRFAIGAAAPLLKPVKNKTVNLRVLTQALLNRTYDDEKELVKSRLACTLDDIRQIGTLIEDNISKAEIVSFGSKAVLEK